MGDGDGSRNETRAGGACSGSSTVGCLTIGSHPGPASIAQGAPSIASREGVELTRRMAGRPVIQALTWPAVQALPWPAG